MWYSALIPLKSQGPMHGSGVEFSLPQTGEPAQANGHIPVVSHTCMLCHPPRRHSVCVGWVSNEEFVELEAMSNSEALFFWLSREADNGMWGAALHYHRGTHPFSVKSQDCLLLHLLRSLSFKHFIYYLFYVYVCASMCLRMRVLVEARRWNQMHWNWSYRSLWEVQCGCWELNSRSLRKLKGLKCWTISPTESIWLSYLLPTCTLLKT